MLWVFYFDDLCHWFSIWSHLWRTGLDTRECACRSKKVGHLFLYFFIKKSLLKPFSHMTLLKGDRAQTAWLRWTAAPWSILTLCVCAWVCVCTDTVITGIRGWTFEREIQSREEDLARALAFRDPGGRLNALHSN